MRYRLISRSPVLQQSLMPEADEQERSISVAFTGHRIIRKEDALLLPDRLTELLERLWESGKTDFFCGCATGFDTLAGQCVLRLKERHPGVRLRLAIPCADQTAKWKEADIRQRQLLIDRADETVILSPEYYIGCMQVRNRYMVNHASLVICYLYHMKGGTMSTVAYASKSHVPVLNIALEDECAGFMQRLAREE